MSIFDILNGGLMGGAATPGIDGASPAQGLGGLMMDPQKMMLLNIGANMLEASQGRPGQGKPGLGGILGAGAKGALQGGMMANQMQLQQAQIGVMQEKLKRQKENEKRYEEFVKSPDFLQLPPQVRAAIESGGPDMLAQYHKGNVEAAVQSPTGAQKDASFLFPGDEEAQRRYVERITTMSKAPITNVNNVSIPAGYQMGQDGRSLSPIPGGPADPANPKNITQGQRTAGLFARRIEQAEKDLQSLENYVPSEAAMATSNLPFGNRMVSDEFQKYDQSRRNFINALLRRESGAVIAESEFDSANKQYFPMPGDSPQVLAQKAKNRALVYEMLKEEAGPAYEVATPTGIPDADKLRQKYGLE